MKLFVIIWHLLYLVAALLLVVRFIGSFFSSKITDQMRRYPVIHYVWGVFVMISFILFMDIWGPLALPMVWADRHDQRNIIRERIQLAGGWSELQQACAVLMEQHRQDGFNWFRGQTNALPPTLAALRPMQVDMLPPGPGLPAPVLRIKMFGQYSTGRMGTPYYGLVVMCRTDAAPNEPMPALKYVSGIGHDHFNRLTDRVFENY